MKALFYAAARGAPLGLLFALLVGCGSSLPLPPTGPHLPDEPAVVVPYPPPPARVEIIAPPQGPNQVVWVDGEWQWKSRRWAWLPGRWEPARQGGYYAPATTVRRADGSLVWFAGVWHVPGKK